MDDYCAFLLSSIILVNGFRPVHDLLYPNTLPFASPKENLYLFWTRENGMKRNVPHPEWVTCSLRRITWSSELKTQILKNEGGALSSGYRSRMSARHRGEGFLSNARESFTDQSWRNIFSDSNTEPEEEASASIYKARLLFTAGFYLCLSDLLRFSPLSSLVNTPSFKLPLFQDTL